MARKKRKLKNPNVSVAKINNKFIVFDPTTRSPLSGIAGQSRSTAFRIAKRLRARS